MYDWNKCEGKHSCVQVIKQLDMEDCAEDAMVYLQVHYACVPGKFITIAMHCFCIFTSNILLQSICY